MRSAILVGLAAALVAGAAAAQPFAFVPNEKSGTVSIIDTTKDAVVGEIKAGEKPRGIAVVGASTEAARPGAQTIRALMEYGYAGHIYPVNPRYTEIGGLQIHRIVARTRRKTVPTLGEKLSLTEFCAQRLSQPSRRRMITRLPAYRGSIHFRGCHARFSQAFL